MQAQLSAKDDSGGASQVSISVQQYGLNELDRGTARSPYGARLFFTDKRFATLMQYKLLGFSSRCCPTGRSVALRGRRTRRRRRPWRWGPTTT